jgi:hypothetical protein
MRASFVIRASVIASAKNPAPDRRRDGERQHDEGTDGGAVSRAA